MYFWSQLIFAILVASFFTLLFVLGLKRPGPWNNFFIFFLIILLTVWAAALWVGPVGPAFYGIYWLPLIMVGLFVAILLASMHPSAGVPKPRRTKTITEVYEEEEKKQEVKQVFNVFFWILIAFLIILIFIGLFRPGLI
jgi:hypothetical protein